MQKAIHSWEWSAGYVQYIEWIEISIRLVYIMGLRFIQKSTSDFHKIFWFHRLLGYEMPHS